MVATLSTRTTTEAQKEIKAMKKAGIKIVRTQKSARAFLLTNGFITKGNKLTKAYR